MAAKGDARIVYGAVVQIDPSLMGRSSAAGAFLTVTSVSEQGIKGFVSAPVGPGKETRWQKHTLRWEEFEYVGEARWAPPARTVASDAYEERH